MANVNIHDFNGKNFFVSLRHQDGNSKEGCAVLTFKVGDDEVVMFFHDNKIDRALLDIDTAIRAYLDNRQ